MTRSIAPFGIRMPEELKQKLTEQAQNNRRSLNSELVMRLEESLKKELKSNE